MNVAARRLVAVTGVAALACGALIRGPLPMPQAPVAGATSIRAAGRHAIGELAFLPDRDESQPGVRYGYGRGGFSVGITPSAAVFAQLAASQETDSAQEPRFATFRMDVVGGAGDAELRGESPRAWRTNVYHGDDRSQWREGVPNYARVRSREVLPGVDVVYRAEGRCVAFDFEVAPGTDPSDIAVAFAVGDDRAPSVRIDAAGALVVTSGDEAMRFGAPVVYQDTADGRAPVAGGYALRPANDGGTHVAFTVGAYDRSLPLVIDPPTLGSASYLGGTANDNAIGAALGVNGEIYVSGITLAAFFATNNYVGGTTGGQYDGFVAQIDVNGAVLGNAVFGGSATDFVYDIVVDPVSDDLFVAGTAFVSTAPGSVPFPSTPGTYAGPGGTSTRGFVVRLDSSLELVASAATTFERGMSFRGVSVADGHVGIACETSSRNLPTTPQSAHPAYPPAAFSAVAAVLVLSDDLTALQAATYVGEANGRAVDCMYKEDGDLAVCGVTTGDTLPAVNAPQPAPGGGTEGWYAEYGGDLATVEVCTYIGGPGFDLCFCLAEPSDDPALADYQDDVFVVGANSAALTPPLTTGVFHGGNDAFVGVVRPNAFPVLANIGGSGNELPTSMVFAGGGFYLLCYTDSFGDYELVPELGPGGAPSDICIDAYDVIGTTLVRTPGFDPVRCGGSGGDPAGSILFLHTPGQPADVGNVLCTWTASSDDVAPTANGAQQENASDGASTDDTFIAVFGTDPPCPKPATPTHFSLSSVREFDDPPAYVFGLEWDDDDASVPVITSYELVIEPMLAAPIHISLPRADVSFPGERLNRYSTPASLDLGPGTYKFELRAVNDCGARSDVAKTSAVAPDPRVKKLGYDRKTAFLTPFLKFASIEDFEVEVEGTATALGLDPDIQILRGTSSLNATIWFKKPSKTSSLSGTIRIPAGSKTGSIQFTNAGLTFPVKFNLKVKLNGKTKSVKFTLKPPKPQ